MEYCSAIQKDRFEAFVEEWMHAENMALSEISQTHKLTGHLKFLTLIRQSTTKQNKEWLEENEILCK